MTAGRSWAWTCTAAAVGAGADDRGRPAAGHREDHQQPGRSCAREIARAGKSPKVVLEATYGWYWAADTLAAAGAEVHLAHPLGVKAFTYRRVKNDERDSADLADLLRMGRLPEAWIAPHEVRELRSSPATGIYADVGITPGSGRQRGRGRRSRCWPARIRR